MSRSVHSQTVSEYARRLGVLPLIEPQTEAQVNRRGMMNKLKMLVLTALVGATVGVGALAAAPSASAETAFPGKLTIVSLGNDRYNLVASGNFGSAHWDGVDVSIRLWGDDEWYDDLLYTPPGTIHLDLWDRHFERAFSVGGSVLNEDWGADEIYADARLYDHATGKLFLTIKTNNLYGNWS
jgi:hypothetical protein